MKNSEKITEKLKDAVAGMEAFFMRVKLSPDRENEIKTGIKKPEIMVLLKKKAWQRVRGLMELFDRYCMGTDPKHMDDPQIGIEFDTIDNDFYEIGDQLNKKCKADEKLWVSMSGHQQKEIDWQNLELGEEPSEAEYEETRKQFFNFICLPYDVIKNDKPTTFSGVFKCWDKWIKNTPPAKMREYLDKGWQDAIGPRLEQESEKKVDEADEKQYIVKNGGYTDQIKFERWVKKQIGKKVYMDGDDIVDEKTSKTICTLNNKNVSYEEALKKIVAFYNKPEKLASLAELKKFMDMFKRLKAPLTLKLNKEDKCINATLEDDSDYTEWSKIGPFIEDEFIYKGANAGWDVVLKHMLNDKTIYDPEGGRAPKLEKNVRYFRIFFVK